MEWGLLFPNFSLTLWEVDFDCTRMQARPVLLMQLALASQFFLHFWLVFSIQGFGFCKTMNGG